MSAATAPHPPRSGDHTSPAATRPTALVTGASGFTGGHLARILARRGWRVRALLRRPDAAAGLAAEGIEPAVGALDDPAALRAVMEGCSHVFHLAAVYREARHPDAHYWKVNVEGTARLLEVARELGVERFLHCSTVGVHGDVDRVPADEQAPLKPHDVYQRSKLAGERLVQEAIRDGFPATVVRPAAIYGPGDRRLLKLFRGIRKRRFVLFGRGENFYHLVHVDDLVDGMIRCMVHPAAVGETFILAGPRYVRVAELVEIIARILEVPPPRLRLPLAPLLLAADLCERLCRPLGIEPPLHRRRCDFFCKSRAFDIGKVRRLLGWRPRFDLEEGLRRTAAWYRAQGWLA